MLPAASPDPAAEALADAAARGDSAAIAALLPPLAPAPPQAALDAALLAAAGSGCQDFMTPTLVQRDAAAALLLAAGAAVDAVDADGATPLLLAASFGNVPLIRRLLAAGARVDAPAGNRYSGAMPQHLAAHHGDCEALALFLDSGGQVRPPQADGDGVQVGGTMGGLILLAADRSSLKTCTSPARLPWQVDAVNGRGRTAMHVIATACWGFYESASATAAMVAVTELLLQRGACVDARDQDGETPLHGAARCWDLEAMRLLLDRGAEIDARDGQGRTPLMVLFEGSGDVEGVSAPDAFRFLASRGADANAVDASGRSPLSHACGHEDTDADTVPALLAAGARVGRDNGPQLIDELIAAAADADHPDMGQRVGAIDALIDAGAGVSFANVSALAEAAAGRVDEDLMGAVPRVLAAAQRALDEDEGARVAARLAAAVEADRRDVASGLRALITGAAAETRRLEAARAALAQEERAAAAPNSSGGDETKPLAKRARRG
jgi:ankyrin repeat protein